jgi:hypothetical protein
MAQRVITIRRSTDERGAQTRVASKRVRDLQSFEPVNLCDEVLVEVVAPDRAGADIAAREVAEVEA